MSHELRTPMNGVIGTAELLRDTTLDGDQRLYVDTIVESGRALLTIINDILELSRLQSSAPVLARQPFDLVDCLRRAVELLRPTATAKGLVLSFESAAGAPQVLGDDGRLRQIVLNLLGNAIKFTEIGGVTVRLSVQPGAAGLAVAIAIADSGIGIPPDRIEAVFESFTQADAEVSRRFGGTGLGLAISRRLARLMGGDIAVRSAPGEGSEFTLALTFEAADIAVGGAAAEAAAGNGPTGACAQEAEGALAEVTLLLAEDNRTNAMIVERMLRPSGARLVHAADGARAVALFAETAPDLVLMDLSMPGLTGFEAVRAMRAAEAGGGPHRPIVALTASAFEETRTACLAAGFDGFVSKPLSRGALLAEIARLLPARVGAPFDSGSHGHAAASSRRDGACALRPSARVERAPGGA